ncbi:MAG: 2-isopropylmalate synthase [Chloroflexi bacterium]|nr:MAG: 2-isopropylmalate synthase [Chloroflexota bacterium]
MTDYVKIFDTTLRDGEQSPGFALTSPQKVEMAHQLARLGVDVIEAGFPAASPDDFAAVERIAREVRGPVIAGLARAVAADIDQCWEAIKDAQRPRIHTFLSSSDIHLEAQFNLKREQAKTRALEMVRHARGYTPDVEFSPMDATRSDWAYVCEVLEAVIDAGATTVNIADTCGFAQPDEFGMMITYIREHVGNIENATLSVHCHNDLGLAVANSLAAIRAGARQIECCVNGIGERAGNAALEELVMALTVRRDHHRVKHGINLEELVPTSALLQQFTGIAVQPNKAIVGLNAFAHESGIHQDGMLKDARTYEIMSAAAIGAEGTRLVLGKHSGRHALRRRLEELGLLLTQDELNHAFAGFKSLADYKKEVTDEDLVLIAENGRRAADGVFDAIGHVYR